MMRARRVRRIVPASALVAGAIVVASPARAEVSAIEASFDVQLQHLRAMPNLEHSASQLGDFGRNLPETDIGTGNAESFLGAGFGIEAVVHDRVRLPILGFSLASAIGSSPRVFGSIDGSIVEVDTWKSGLLTVLFPGYGFRIKDRRWMFEGAAQPGLAYLFTSGAVAQGAARYDASFHAASFLVQVDLAACRRIDPVERACLFAAPAIYEFGVFQAWTVGFRWELGP